jgi:hypothetical protein
MAPMTESEPGDRRPRALERRPGERYGSTGDGTPRATLDDRRRLAWAPVAVAVGTAIVYPALGELFGITAGLIVVAGFAGWLLGKLVGGPSRAAGAAIATVVVGLAGIWLVSRLEGGVLDPIGYLDAVQGWPLVVIQIVVAGGLAAASSRAG